MSTTSELISRNANKDPNVEKFRMVNHVMNRVSKNQMDRDKFTPENENQAPSLLAEIIVRIPRFEKRNMTERYRKSHQSIKSYQKIDC